MPGAYAHLTLVNLLKEPSRLEKDPKLPEEAIMAVMENFKFCELGTVSPDYPYLSVGDKKAAAWADLMHYMRAGQMIRAGIIKLQSISGDAKAKGLAWLLGYAAHVATDVSIHPVVYLKVGDYASHKKQHRICELNQDAYIFQRMNLGKVGLSEYLDSGIAECAHPKQRKQLDSAILALWRDILGEVHPAEFKTNPPNINKWHSRFKFMVDKIAEEGDRLLPIARHLGVKCGLTYPNPDEIDRQYIDGLDVPGNRKEDYDRIFDTTIKNVQGVWKLIADGVYCGDQKHVAKLGNWNLDTGMDENGDMVFWG